MSDLPPTESGDALGAFHNQAAEALATVADLGATGAAAAAAIDAAFAKAGDSLAKTLAKAASDGKVSLGDLATAVIRAADVSAQSSSGGSTSLGLAGALGSALKGVFAGARADGGSVDVGGAYLVGERGPELFRPSTSGDIVEAPAAGEAGPSAVGPTSAAEIASQPAAASAPSSAAGVSGGESGQAVFRPPPATDLYGDRASAAPPPSPASDAAPARGGGMIINLTVQGGGAPSILRSEAQIAAALARAVSMGGR